MEQGGEGRNVRQRTTIRCERRKPASDGVSGSRPPPEDGGLAQGAEAETRSAQGRCERKRRAKRVHCLAFVLAGSHKRHGLGALPKADRAENALRELRRIGPRLPSPPAGSQKRPRGVRGHGSRRTLRRIPSPKHNSQLVDLCGISSAFGLRLRSHTWENSQALCQLPPAGRDRAATATPSPLAEASCAFLLLSDSLGALLTYATHQSVIAPLARKHHLKANQLFSACACGACTKKVKHMSCVCVSPHAVGRLQSDTMHGIGLSTAHRVARGATQINGAQRRTR